MTCIVSILLFRIEKPVKKNKIPRMIVVGISFFLIINSGIPTKHVFNITVVVGILP